MQAVWDSIVAYCNSTTDEFINIFNTMGPQGWGIVGAVVATGSILLLRTNFK